MPAPKNSDLKLNVCLLPTKAEVEATPGTPLTKELARLQAEGQLPKSIDTSRGSATMHRLSIGDNDFVVIMLDPPPCGCVRLVSGKKKRCKRHRQERRARRREAKKGKQKRKMVKDDMSDRKKAVELRHAPDTESDEDRAIDGAITPDKVVAVGPAGVAVLVDIDRVEGAEVGPRKKIREPIKGILVKGAHETPQFIPNEKIEKGADGEPKFRKYTRGTLVRGPHGESIFYADKQCQPDSSGNPLNVFVKGVDEKLQKRIGDTVCPPCEVEVNEKGMPVLVQITNAENVPKDKHATVGVLVRNEDGVVVLAQTGGQAVGAPDNAECVPTTSTDKAPGDVIGRVMEEKGTGKQTVTHPSKEPDAGQKVVGTIVQGTFNEPVLVREVWVKTVYAGDTIPAVKKAEMMEKKYQDQIEKANDLVQAQVQGKTAAEIQKDKAASRIAGPLPPEEVYSSSLVGHREHASEFAYERRAADAKADKPAGAVRARAKSSGAGAPVAPRARSSTSEKKPAKSAHSEDHSVYLAKK